MNWEDEESDESMGRDEVRKTALYIKAKEIMELVQGIAALVNDDPKYDSEEFDAHREMTLFSMNEMISSSTQMYVKVAAHYGPSLYDLKMEAATLIRMHAMRVNLNIAGLEMGGYSENDYFQVLRDAIEEFRVLFAEWVKTFDQWDYVIDRWGVFNPPGVNYDDKDPDDDIPFDNPLSDM